MVFDQDEIENSVVAHFSEMFQASDTKSQQLNDTSAEADAALKQLDEMRGTDCRPEVNVDQYESIICSPYTFSELDQILKELPNGKSSGCDTVPNEMLKNAGFKFKNYLLIFLNKILDEGIVPEELNKGKCMLIHKVRNYLIEKVLGLS